MIFVDKVNFTSPSFTARSPSDGHKSKAWIGITGAGTVSVEVEGEDGVWRAYPDLSFTGSTAKELSLPPGRRFRVTVGDIAATVELYL